MSTLNTLSINNETRHSYRRSLYTCGIIATLIYIFINIITVFLYDGYDWKSQTVSELSAIDAPTRNIWVAAMIIYVLLMITFSWGVRQSSGTNNKLKISSTVLLIYSISGFFWPPMHQREVLASGGGSLTDTMHIAFAFITVPLMMLSIGFGAYSFGKSFRLYSLTTLVTLTFFGVLTGIQGPDVGKNLPTPMIGVWERINIGVFMVWIIVLSVTLLRSEKKNA